MSTEDPMKLRVLFCMAVTQNFFDLKPEETKEVWGGVAAMLKGIKDMPGIEVLGTMDDDETMVGTSPDGYPWTCYILAKASDRDAVKNACNLFRVTPVGEYRLWKYMRVEARIGRTLPMPE